MYRSEIAYAILAAILLLAIASPGAATPLWQEQFNRAPTGIVEFDVVGMGTCLSDMVYPPPFENNSKWIIFRAPTDTALGGAGVASGALTLWTESAPDQNDCADLTASTSTYTSSAGEIAVVPGLHLGFSVLCQAPVDWTHVSSWAGIGVCVMAYVPGQLAGESVWYVLDHGSCFPSCAPGFPDKVVYLGSSGTYSVDLWQDFSSALGHPPPDGTHVFFVELRVHGDDWDVEGVPDYCPIAATFDNLWIGQGTSHNLTVTASANPATILSGGTTQLSASASDSSGHGIATWRWSDNGAGGTFSPSANVQSPTWKGPGNTSSSPIQRRLTVTATCNGSPAISKAADVVVTEGGHALTVSASANPTGISSGGTTQLSASASDSSGHGIATWKWSDNGAGGTFSPSANVQKPTWKGPGNNSGRPIQRTLTVTATCSGPPAISKSANVAVTEDPVTVSVFPPVNVSLSPNTGCLAANTKLKFTTKYSDGDGYTNLANCHLLLNTSLNQVNAAFVRYDQNTNLLYVKNDANTSWGTGYAPGSAQVLENSRCKLYCANTSVSGSGTTLTVNWMLEIKALMSGKTCGAWMLVYDDIGLRDGWDQMGSNIRFNRPPYFCGLTPNSGSLPTNTPVTLTARFCDPDGCADITNCYLLINTSLNQVNAIFLRYDRNANLLYLKNDGNTSWLGGYAPGSANTIENARGKLYCANTTVSCSGTTLTITFTIVLKPGWQGVCAWALVYDACGFRDGWDQVACFDVGLPPLNLSLSPNSGSPPVGTPINAMSKYSDPDGYANLANCYLLVNTSLSQENAGFLKYDANANLLYLKNDANTDWGTGYPPGTDQVLENSQCKLYCEYTTVSGSGPTLTVVWKVEIKPSMCGKTCGAWMLVYDDAGLRDGWDKMGTVTLSCPPVNVSLDPNSGDIVTGTQMTLASGYSDLQGYADLANCYLLLNTSLSQVNAAFVRYDANTDLLYVKDDANTTWGTGYPPGSAQILENSQCKLYCADTAVSGLGTDLTVNWRLELKTGIPWTSCKAWMLVYDDAGFRDGWDQMGEFAVQADGQAAYRYLTDVMDRFHAAFDVYTDSDAAGNHFVAKGRMSSLGDEEAVQRMNEACTETPHSGINCIEATFKAISPDSWGGWYFMNGVLEGDETAPKENWGDYSDAGVDMQGATQLTFWARGAQGGERAEFFCLGIGRDADTGSPVAPYPDSSPKVSTGYITLSSDWSEYAISLTGQDLSYVLGGFGWVTNAPENASQDITLYLDDIRYNKPRLDEARFLVSYETVPSVLDFDVVMRNVAFSYDNSLALLAFLALGDQARASKLADAFVYAQQHDRYYDDGRIRDLYQGGDLVLPPGWTPHGRVATVRMPGWYDPETRQWLELQAGSSTGNTAWAMLALLAYYEMFGGSEYLSAAAAMGEWVDLNCRDTRGAGGYTGGLEGWEPNQTTMWWKSTEHNIDLYAAFRKLFGITGDVAWRERTDHAKTFVMGMWDDTEGKFWTGTTDDGVTINVDVIPLDIQAWSVLALKDESGPFRRALDYADAHLRFDPGYDFNDDLDGIWYEGTAQMAAAYYATGQMEKWQTLVSALRAAQFASAGLPAADRDGLTTGFGWLYYHRAHVGATAWLALAELGFNPF